MGPNRRAQERERAAAQARQRAVLISAIGTSRTLSDARVAVVIRCRADLRSKQHIAIAATTWVEKWVAPGDRPQALIYKSRQGVTPPHAFAVYTFRRAL